MVKFPLDERRKGGMGMGKVIYALVIVALCAAGACGRSTKFSVSIMKEASKG